MHACIALHALISSGLEPGASAVGSQPGADGKEGRRVLLIAVDVVARLRRGDLFFISSSIVRPNLKGKEILWEEEYHWTS